MLNIMNPISLRLAGGDTTAISLQAIFYYVIKPLMSIRS